MKLQELKENTIFTYKGYKFQKLANEENSCYCLINDIVFESKFGETNDWAKSEIRKRLNEFDEEGNSLAIQGINKNDLEEVSLNYSAYKIPNGRSRDRITCLSYEEYLIYRFSILRSWLRSGNNGDTHGAYFLSSAGGFSYYNVDASYAVRPALHLKSDINVEVIKWL